MGPSNSLSCQALPTSSQPQQSSLPADAAQQQQQQCQHPQLQDKHPQQKQQQPSTSSVRRRVAVLECEDADRWKGYTEALWKAALQEEGDEWTVFQVCKGNLPTPSEAAGFDAILVSGSHYSVYEEQAWIKQLMQMLPQYVATGTHIYGCCFGCQALAQALGGSVGPNPDGKFVLTIEQVRVTPQLAQFPQLDSVVQQAMQGTCLTASPGAAASADELAAKAALAAASVPAETGQVSAGNSNSAGSNYSSEGMLALSVVEQMNTCSLSNNSSSTASSIDNGGSGSGVSVSPSGDCGDSRATSDNSSGDNNSKACADGGCFRLIESHGDQALSLPPGAVVLASSPTAPYELWSLGNNVLASQFHLEFDEPLVIDKIWTRLTDVGRLDKQQSADSRDALEAGGQHNVQVLQVIKHFLKHGCGN